MPVLQEAQVRALAEVTWLLMDLEGSFLFLIPDLVLCLLPLPPRLTENHFSTLSPNFWGFL